MAKNAAGWCGERCVQVCPTCSGPEQKQLDPWAGWVRDQRSGGFQAAWTAERTSGESGWGVKAALPKAWLVTRVTRSKERGRPVVLDGRTRSAEREDTEEVSNKVRLLQAARAHLGAPAKTLVPCVGLLYKGLDPG